MNEELRKEADEEILLLQKILNLAEKYIPNTFIPTTLYLQGLTIYEGKIIPINSVSHKIIFDGFNRSFYSAFKSLFNQIYTERESHTTEFAFRTLLDLGVENSFLVFNSNVEKKDRDRFTLFNVIADYYQLKNSSEKMFNKDFDKIIKDYSNLLNNKEKIDLPKMLEYKDYIEHGRNVKILRQKLGRIRNELLDKYKARNLLSKNNNFEMLNSGFSHILHGDVLQITNILKESSYKNHIFRVYGNLFISGMEFLRNFSFYVNDSNFNDVVNKLVIRNNEFRKKFEIAWKKLPSQPIELEIVKKQ